MRSRRARRGSASCVAPVVDVTRGVEQRRRYRPRTADRGHVDCQTRPLVDGRVCRGRRQPEVTRESEREEEGDAERVGPVRYPWVTRGRVLKAINALLGVNP